MGQRSLRTIGPKVAGDLWAEGLLGTIRPNTFTPKVFWRHPAERQSCEKSRTGNRTKSPLRTVRWIAFGPKVFWAHLRGLHWAQRSLGTFGPKVARDLSARRLFAPRSSATFGPMVLSDLWAKGPWRPFAQRSLRTTGPKVAGDHWVKGRQGPLAQRSLRTFGLKAFTPKVFQGHLTGMHLGRMPPGTVRPKFF